MSIEKAGTFKLGGEIEVYRMGYGAMRLCGPGVWGRPADPEMARQVLHRVRELGINLIDTSDAYGPEINEYQMADHLHPYTGLTLATKGGLTRGGPNNWVTDGRPEHLERAVANSLRRLQVEAIDLYQLHAVEDDVPFADSLGALIREKEKGNIRHIGLSNVSVDQLKEAMETTKIATVQNRYSVAFRKYEDVLRHCDAHGVGFIPWYPLEAGSLAEDTGSVAQVAAKYDATPSQVALAWLLARSPIMLPIPGTSSVAHLEENTAAIELKLDDEDMALLAG